VKPIEIDRFDREMRIGITVVTVLLTLIVGYFALPWAIALAVLGAVIVSVRHEFRLDPETRKYRVHRGMVGRSPVYEGSFDELSIEIERSVTPTNGPDAVRFVVQIVWANPKIAPHPLAWFETYAEAAAYVAGSLARLELPTRDGASLKKLKEDLGASVG